MAPPAPKLKTDIPDDLRDRIQILMASHPRRWSSATHFVHDAVEWHVRRFEGRLGDPELRSLMAENERLFTLIVRDAIGRLRRGEPRSKDDYK